MSSRLLSFSLGLNLILLGLVGYLVAIGDSSAGNPLDAPISQTDHMSDNAPAPSEDSRVMATSEPLRWDELESKDFQTYVANLRKAGCPAPVVRRIIGAEIKELYARKAFALVQDFHRNFWEIAAREGTREYFDKTFGQQVKALCAESDLLSRELLGEVPRELPTKADSTINGRLTDYLSSEKQEQLRRITERYNARLEELRRANLSPEEKTAQQAQFRLEMESEQAQILSPEELAEYQLRQSSAAIELQQLHGVDFSEGELHKLAKVIDDYNRLAQSQPDLAPETLDQKLQALLGPARFADFTRAHSATYKELYQLVSDFGLPGETAAQLFDLRLESEKHSDKIRADKNRSTEEKQALLDDLHDQVEQTMLTKLGAGAYQSYKARNGRWINSLGRL